REPWRSSANAQQPRAARVCARLYLFRREDNTRPTAAWATLHLTPTCLCCYIISPYIRLLCWFALTPKDLWYVWNTTRKLLMYIEGGGGGYLILPAQNGTARRPAKLTDRRTEIAD